MSSYFRKQGTVVQSERRKSSKELKSERIESGHRDIVNRQTDNHEIHRYYFFEYKINNTIKFQIINFIV